MRHTISVLVENEFGVLSRVSGLFSGRGFNIESLCVAETMEPQVSRMTIVTTGNDQIVEQILKQLNKLIPVLKVIDFTGVDTVDRELVLVKVNAEGDGKQEVLRLVDIFRARIVDDGGRGEGHGLPADAPPPGHPGSRAYRQDRHLPRDVGAAGVTLEFRRTKKRRERKKWSPFTGNRTQSWNCSRERRSRSLDTAVRDTPTRTT
jgi:acetolactate synthase small subunit